MLCTVVPSGISESGTAFPVRLSEPGPEMTRSPWCSPFGCRMYRFSPSAYTIRAMRALRFGSYSISETLPGIPNLFRLKSILRYCRLCPPPRWRDVRWPWLLRPPDFLSGSSSDFSGSARVISSKPLTDLKRVAAVIGRNWRMLISALEHGDRVAVLERDDGLLPAWRRPAGAATGDRMAAHLHGADARGCDAEELLERIAD